ncbi:ABC transporter substrate-binding protein [Agromyces sp. NPDC060279]|uniref:ABC transporter substrate-binding protein n=1 Tax=Agromyces sp. NPDC060279 TaxID=3347092 RepID=UPI003667BEA8
MPTRRMRLTGAAAAVTALALGLAACSAPGGSRTEPAAPVEEITAPVTPEQVAELGEVTLSVWADQGEQDFMDQLVPAYEAEFPNVTVDIQFKSFNDLTATVLNAMNSADAPDVAQGNQGWATDGALVKAGLIRPLDDVADAYDYRDAAGDAITQLQWSEDGAAFGEGAVYGMSPDNQMVGLFSNREKLAALGLGTPTTLDELEAAFAAAKAAGQTPLVLGNADKASAMQTFSILQGALTPAADTRAWITGAKDADFAVDSNREALDRFAEWVAKGYVSAGYDGTSPDDAAAAFASGEGVFFIGGNWYAGAISDGSAFDFTPGLSDGDYASSGSFGMPWHVSSKSDATLAAIAFVGMVNSPESAELLAGTHRVPIQPVEAAGDDAMFAALLDASAAQLDGAGPLYWYDWATDTMFDTFTGGLQEVLAGRESADALLERVQSDWVDFHTD